MENPLNNNTKRKLDQLESTKQNVTLEVKRLRKEQIIKDTDVRDYSKRIFGVYFSIKNNKESNDSFESILVSLKKNEKDYLNQPRFINASYDIWMEILSYIPLLPNPKQKEKSSEKNPSIFGSKMYSVCKLFNSIINKTHLLWKPYCERNGVQMLSLGKAIKIEQNEQWKLAAKKWWLSIVDERTIEEALTKQRNVFITGPAGTGKSYVTKRILKFLRDKNIEVLITAPTASVATELDKAGKTFHHAFCIPSQKYDVNNILCDKRKMGNLMKGLKKKRVLLIDEVSMLHRQDFESADAIAKRTFGKSEPFGGLQVIAVGDFCQLPPVHKDKSHTQWTHRVFQSDTWKHLEFINIELCQPYRQDDILFFDTLCKIRLGQYGPNEKSFLQQRMVNSIDDIPNPADITQIATTNNLVDMINQTKYNELDKLSPKKLIEYKFAPIIHDMVRDDLILSEDMKRKLRAFQIPEDGITLKVGTLVMITRNIDIEHGFYNGRKGVVTSFTNTPGGHFPVIKFSNGEEKVLYRQDIEFRDEEFGVPSTHRNNDKLYINWIWLRYAWSSTVHKSQGATIDKIFIDLNNSFEKGIVYVALSRSKDPNSMYIKRMNPSAIRVDCDKNVLEFYKTIKYTKKVYS